MQAKIIEITDVGIVTIRFNTTLHNITDISRNINDTDIDMYIAPSNDWHLWEEGFELSTLNFTWAPWKFYNTTRKIIQSVFDPVLNQTNRTVVKVNETELVVNLTFA